MDTKQKQVRGSKRPKIEDRRPFIRLIDRQTKRILATTNDRNKVRPLVDRYVERYDVVVDMFTPFLYRDEYTGWIICAAHCDYEDHKA